MQMTMRYQTLNPAFKTYWLEDLLSKALKSPLLSKAECLKCLKTWGITMLCLYTLTQYVHIVQSDSNSMYKRYFIHFESITPKKGDITMTYIPLAKFNTIKNIIGTQGDKITLDKQGNISVAGFKVGKALKKNKDGIALNSITPMVIPKDYVFLYAPHPRSFDSRYIEFGLVHKSKLKGKLIAIA